MKLPAIPGIAAALAVASIAATWASPSVVFNPSTLKVTTGAAASTPPIVVQGGTGVTSITLNVVIPAGITIDTSTNSSTGNLNCLTVGANAGLFFSEWNAATNTISVTTSLSGTDPMEVVHSIAFTCSATSPVTITMSGSLTGGSQTPAFGTLTVTPHAVTFAAQPAVQPNAVKSLATTQCSASASDSWGGTVSYSWSAGGAGGSFSSSTAQNPVYTAPDDASASDITVTLSCTAASVASPSVKATATVPLTVYHHSITIASGTGTTVSPSAVIPGGIAQCSVSATDSLGNTMTYQWSDGGAGGSFSSGAVTNPTYTAPRNSSGSNLTVTLSCKVTDSKNAAVNATGTVALTVHPTLVEGLAVTSSPNAGASIAFSPSPDSSGHATPQAAPCTLQYNTTTGSVQVTLTAPTTDRATHPMWFDHWVLDGVSQPQGTRALSVTMSTASRAGPSSLCRAGGRSQ